MARSSPPARSAPYAPPRPLEDLHILDVLELAGSQHKAARALEIHQTTVCRSLQLMQQQFRLANAPGSSIYRHGHNPCLHYLRLAYREHRLMAGQLRIGSDVLHHGLLVAMAGVQAVPPRFRSAEHWVALVQHGLLDGAILSSFSLAKPLPADQEPAWAGMAVVPLGSLSLQLVAPAGQGRSVLLPRKAAMPRSTRRWRATATPWSSSRRPARSQRPGSSGPATASWPCRCAPSCSAAAGCRPTGWSC